MIAIPARMGRNQRYERIVRIRIYNLAVLAPLEMDGTCTRSSVGRASDS